jgi:hypothetical protein
MDSSGAVVPGAKVTLSNSGTGIRQETSTTPTGNYAIASLPVGRYTLAVEHPVSSAKTLPLPKIAFW